MKVNETYYNLLDSFHILIAGSAGSGKSTLIDSLMYTALAKGNCYFMLIDPKRVSLRKYRNMKNVLARATEPEDAIEVLNRALEIMENRYKEMEARDMEMSDRPDIWIIIDEVADLILTHGKDVTPLLQRLVALGRAARIHCVTATQTVLASIISTPIKNNYDTIIALRVATSNQSRVILNEKGAEKLPLYGYGIIARPATIKKTKLPMTDPEELRQMIKLYE